MVKIIDKSTEELKEEARLNKLERIAREVCGEKFKINTKVGNIYLHSKLLMPNNPDFFVYLMTGKNEVLVSNSSYLNDAIKLAEAYEASGETEFTVKKDY